MGPHGHRPVNRGTPAPAAHNDIETVRSIIVRIIGEVEEGQLLDDTIDRHFSSPSVPDRFKPLIHEITSGVFRWKLYFDWVLSHFLKKPIKEELRYLLWSGLYQLFFMKKAAYHVVSEVVEFAKKQHGQGPANFVNAVLRRSIREREQLTLPPDLLDRLSVEYSFPLWLVKQWHDQFGIEGVTALLRELNKAPEFTLRTDVTRMSFDHIIEHLRDIGVQTRKGTYLETALHVDTLKPVLNDELLKSHIIHVQDEASQMVALALSPSQGQTILDACAGQGTKTSHIKELCPESRVIAIDIMGRKLRSIYGANFVIKGDVLKNPFKRGAFDSILLDAPCSSLGIIRKHPEIKWRRTAADIAGFGDLQRAMIRTLSENLRPGGLLIYSVCSFQPEETIRIVEQVTKEGLFIVERPLIFPTANDCFLSLPHETGMDGFFIAALRKQ
jgi:16S rRNA (cytosine967-C5)-methyltransferase